MTAASVASLLSVRAPPPESVGFPRQGSRGPDTSRVRPLCCCRLQDKGNHRLHAEIYICDSDQMARKQSCRWLGLFSALTSQDGVLPLSHASWCNFIISGKTHGARMISSSVAPEDRSRKNTVLVFQRSLLLRSLGISNF